MADVEYQVIARRWRPKTFSELIGQEHIIRILEQAIERNRIAHAFLFIGPRGTGKTSTARLLAAALNAVPQPSLQADPDLPLTRSILEGNCVDVIEIDGASNNSVEQIRALREECRYMPTECRYKIYILDEIHMLSISAFNALLKVLEEPPAHVKFIFATTEASKIPVTIASRCQRFEFHLLPREILTQALQKVAKAENISIEPMALEALARIANGSLRDAQTYLDQMITFSDGLIREEDVLALYGLVTQKDLESLSQCLWAEDYAGILRLSDQLEAQGCDFSKILLDLQEYMQQLLLQERSTELGNEIPNSSILAKILERLSSAYESVQSGLSEKVNFEMALFRAIETCQMRNIDEVIRKLRKQARMDEASPSSPSSSALLSSSRPSENLSGMAVAKIKEAKLTEDISSTESFFSTDSSTGKEIEAVKTAASSSTSPLKFNQDLVAKLPSSTRQKLTEVFGVEWSELK
ncbi:MAG: DNA polymerase III subunit gamma/tau [Puniceicoccales bacterium]|jgi:DNA polymerase-3 subunit gamma/tau|nr:DNA polymerase III subunit gamma/tau [Puniceicoccales bacterium]